jgi:SAM-dependent methyltransferase
VACDRPELLRQWEAWRAKGWLVTGPSFSEQKAAWRAVPVDDLGYLHAGDLLTRGGPGLRAMVAEMEAVRYGGWRNHGGRWRAALGLDSTHDALLLDYGCGVGLEAFQYARAGNRVVVADINADSVALAQRVLAIHEVPAYASALILDPPDLDPAWAAGVFDVIVANGVLHHIPDPRPTMELLHRLLSPEGELRLMLYSAEAWIITVGGEPPEDVYTSSGFQWFVRSMDAVGGWADWYNRDRLEKRFGDLFMVTHVEYLTPDGRDLAATLEPR